MTSQRGVLCTRTLLGNIDAPPCASMRICWARNLIGFMIGVTNATTPEEVEAAVRAEDIQHPTFAYAFMAMLTDLHDDSPNLTSDGVWLNGIGIEATSVVLLHEPRHHATLAFEFSPTHMSLSDELSICSEYTIPDALPQLVPPLRVFVSAFAIDLEAVTRVNTTPRFSLLAFGGLGIPNAACSLCEDNLRSACQECIHCGYLCCEEHHGTCECGFVGCVLCIAHHPHL